ncbi:hypothetical protein WA026_007582 [Henosepilachna vigintioctopunctata]|uniref:Uncharacterized protein n=1 Tax=Henosepilachna vigintioctopunctata TaxID=420089 RepID=A0AAW1UW83_9CUCU
MRVLRINSWKANHFTKLIWIILISSSIFLLTRTQLEFKAPNISMKFDNLKNNITHYFINTPGCKIPKWPIFSKGFEKYFQYEFTGPSCNNGRPPLVQSNITSLFLIEDHFANYNIADHSLVRCCYEELKRKIPRNGEDERYKFGDSCIAFEKTADILMEFVHVKCNYANEQIYEDFFAFIPQKHNETFTYDTQNKYNVLIMGLDSISRLNFHRQMPKTVKFLKDSDFVEFLGYNKLADNTHPNLITVLTGYDEATIRRTCRTSSDYFDNCNFIWDNFKAENYITSFGRMQLD